jgi:adenylylsulfate kinase
MKMMNNSNSNNTITNNTIDHLDREALLSQKGSLIWFTGLSGSGKSTIASALEKELHIKKKATYVLDGDTVRTGLTKDLTFSTQDRAENIRRIGEVGKLFADAGLICIAACISPFEKDRQIVRSKIPTKFIEVHIATSLEVCESRDPKGLYKKARAGEIKNMTGIDSAYEIPTNPEITIFTANKSVQECVSEIMKYLSENNFLSQRKLYK